MELKAKRTYRFIVYKIEEKQKQVIVEKVGEPGQGYEDFTACLPADECRYAVYDFDFLTEENVPKSRIFFIAWYVYDLVALRTALNAFFLNSLQPFLNYEGPQILRGSEAKWFTLAPRTGSRENSMEFR